MKWLFVPMHWRTWRGGRGMRVLRLVLLPLEVCAHGLPGLLRMLGWGCQLRRWDSIHFREIERFEIDL